MALFAREVLIVLTTPSFVPAYAYVGLLGLALVVHSSYQVISIGVQLGGRTSSMAWTSGAAAALNLLLNFILIPSFGLWGASVATVVAYLISTCLLYLVAQRHFPIPYRPLQPVLIGVGVLVLVPLACCSTSSRRLPTSLSGDHPRQDRHRAAGPAADGGLSATHRPTTPADHRHLAPPVGLIRS